ncbi:retrovirus-related Pol polyprotein from transposon TNT 1-94 [Trichonephila inaurata madagascariensis]|uniref:Retrovirus-related Pol polyprotein from transposon TNT 1-94 n=1 Tax=Trichonephila inaurata madagascariensis TaxID=2747483 RepID=A0A8X6WTF3_9ARAC|nr:retrovirus-related Pol polyprotein from transposon TNT 1-94 [Trichonephila inaurata madagascariensis]
MEIVKKPLQTPDPDVEKEIEEISCSAEDREETLAEESSRNSHDRVDFSETFNLVVQWNTMRTVQSIAAARKQKLGPFEVKTAFLYGAFSEGIYMAQPEGFSDSSGQALYVLMMESFTADEEQTVNLFLKKLESEFSVVIGEANYFLGMQIEHLECGKIFMHQEAH